uniref:Hypothetical conserved protein n=2 Tax=Candidatus Bipolaricaulota TaxID=67810 RepID=H5SNF4_9BACT|nr:hypothetical conserved protein [uncultured Acetothermia bacterium]BAL59374.1 hypothetical conserved protein [Candidatus Acetothermum autotrophicum]
MARPKSQASHEHKILLGLDRATGNFWVDTGLVVLLEQFGEGDHPVNEVLSWLQGQLLQPSGNKGEYYDQATEQIREYDKVNWVYPTNLFIKVSGQAPKVKIDGKEYFLHPPKFELNLKLSKKSDTCDLCGNTAPLTDAAMWMYPFVVDPQKFGTFYPGTKRGLKLCARCALAGLAGYLGWLWKAQGRDALHFFIFHSDLRELRRLHQEVLAPLRLSGEKGGTAPVAFAGPYVNETALGLLLELFQHVRKSDVLSDDARQLLASLLGATEAVPPAPITLYAITGTPGQAFQMKALREFSKLQRFYRLYEGWLDLISQRRIDPNPHQRLALIWGQFWVQQGQNRESIWRERIAWALLEFGDPTPFVEQFLFEARAREENPRPLVRGTIEVLNQYLREVFAMDEQFQRTLAGFGHSLGTAAQQHNEMGLLYALRNAKNPEDFYRVLNDAQFRLQITIPEALLRIERGERIVGAPWVRVKTLLSIYAMNAYLRRSMPQQEVQATQEG